MPARTSARTSAHRDAHPARARPGPGAEYFLKQGVFALLEMFRGMFRVPGYVPGHVPTFQKRFLVAPHCFLANVPTFPTFRLFFRPSYKKGRTTPPRG